MPDPITAGELASLLIDLMPGIGRHMLLLDDGSWSRILVGLRLLEASEADEDNYVAWLQFHGSTIRTCDSDAEGAFRVYRHPAKAAVDREVPRG